MKILENKLKNNEVQFSINSMLNDEIKNKQNKQLKLI
jgi:hypothetical protein